MSLVGFILTPSPLKASGMLSSSPYLLGNTICVRRQRGGERVVVHYAIGPQVIKQVLQRVHLVGVDVVECDGCVGAALKALGCRRRGGLPADVRAVRRKIRGGVSVARDSHTGI